MTRPSNSRERGIALIITLILLSVITFLAVTFLVISRRASEQVSTVTQQAVAKQAADAAAQQAMARVIANMLGQINPANGQPQPNGFNFGLFVSTNFQSPFYNTGQTLGTTNLANVNYYDSFGNLLAGNNYLQMLNNMLVLPRPPVFITTNAAFAPDFRFYLDLNRNGVFDSNGPVVVVDQFGQLETNYVGDPEWIGVLEHPDQPHSRSNLFVARYCFLAQPIGNSLDVNYIHNDAKLLDNTMLSDGFLRNQGVGTWEINLAGFFYALSPFDAVNNPSGWSYLDYDTRTPPNLTFFRNSGTAFDAATAILQYRYNGTYLSPANLGYPPPGLPVIGGRIDYNPTGPLTTGESLPFPLNPSRYLYAWSGADNVEHFYTPADFFTFSAANSGAVSGRLLNLGETFGTNAFNRYNFYRMLAQLGMESAPDTAKLNLNYKNVDGYATSNYVSWAETADPTTQNNALEFFMHAGDMLLKSQPAIVSVAGGVAISITNIPVYPFNFYTPSIHRMLQLAANIYDAANPKTNGFDYPSVFRPVFNASVTAGITNIWISGYTEVTNTNGFTADYTFPAYSLTTPPGDTNGNGVPAIMSRLAIGSNDFNVYGIPWVIGAKKYLPNFNQISLESYTALTRKVQIDKGSLASPRTSWQTNIQYILAVTNAVMAQAWNSYVANYPRAVDVLGRDTLTLTIANENGVIVPINFYSTNLTIGFQLPTVQSNAWTGIGLNLSSVAASFRIPLNATSLFLQPSIYSTNGVGTGTFVVVPNLFTAPIAKTAGFPLPQLTYTVSNRVRFVMVDHETGRVIDYVQLEGMGSQRGLTSAGELGGNDDWGPAGVWDTNRQPRNSSNPNNLLLGVQHQIDVSMNGPVYTEPGYATPTSISDWNWGVMGLPGLATPADAVNSFIAFFNKNTNQNPSIVMQVPFTPTRSVCVYYTWQANDPLVHYTLPDLTDLISTGLTGPETNWVVTNIILGNTGQINKRYYPWNGAQRIGSDPAYNTNMALKDPLVTKSDDWQFPDTKFANIGWLGRVHRGTPWQTVYMKSAPVDPTLWENWTGNQSIFPSTLVGSSDAVITQPTNDWSIFDLFTTAPNDNATRGQLSVNQTNYAAWAALLDGVVVLTNDPVNGLSPIVIDPNPGDANNNAAALYTIFTGIENARANVNIPTVGLVPRPGAVFTRVGDILSAPELTAASPFVDPNDPTGILNDAAYEWLPGQIMSLLRVGSPRYVIYAYGQSLKPADNSIQSSGPFYGTCKNYQITGEAVTRTVVRFEPSAPLNPASPFTPLNPTQNPAMPGQPYQNPYSLPANLPTNGQPAPRAVIESFTVLPPQ